MTQTSEFDFERTALHHGGHNPAPKGTPPEEAKACFGEGLYLLALGRGLIPEDERWSAQPSCVCPTISSIYIAWNDRCGNDERRARVLWPLRNVVLGTKGSAALRDRRHWFAVNWAARTRLVKTLRLFKFDDYATEIEALPEIVDRKTANKAYQKIDDIRSALWVKRNELWNRIYKDAVAVAAADAVAVAAADAVAVAVADAAAAAAAVAVADAAAAAAAAAAADPRLQRIIDAAKAANGSWSERYRAARKVADEVIPELIKERFGAVDFVAESDRDFADLIRALCDMKDAA